ncbi:hypothetical protein PVAND_001464 [Polypedilum vanderplanki]|uniref:Medium-chain acyl-CoA ligase ACSF2, mitochondrial n=1 Tax=Polypedilum vanderplanki TaxID=319348 RepID=A0A9J6BNH3_POLVA|nr:hypothetical protein PVAND_001464 [Polypedilum vanderplanki]
MIRNCFRIKKFSVRFSSTISSKPSYYHRVEGESFQYLTIGQLLKQATEKYGDRQAFISCEEKSQISFNEALHKANKLASGLLNLGLEKGDRVAIWSPNFEFWYTSYMAIARAGLICVTLNPAYTIPELNFCLNKVGVKAIISPEVFRKQQHYEMLSTLIPQLKNSKAGKIEGNATNSLQHVITVSDKKLPGAINFLELLNLSSENDLIKVEELQSSISVDDGSMIQFTSGTTGQPKATLLSHFAMVNSSYYSAIRNSLDKIYMKCSSPLPFFHVGGSIVSVLGSLHFGATLVSPSPHFDGEAMLRSIVNEKCNMMIGTPTFFVDLWSKQRALNLKIPEILIACVGGSLLSPQIVKDLETILKVKKISSVYGLTETSSVIMQTLPGDSNQSVEEFVGTVSKNVEAKIIDRDGKTVNFGEPGELCIRTSLNMLCYFNDPEKTKEVMGDDRWLKTGDQFILYENGYGKVVGRIKDMIIRGGENIFPKEIEDYLNTHEDIAETQVIGIPDDRMGEEVGAFIKLKDSSKTLTQNDIKEFCKNNLAHFKVPKFVIIVEDFPKTLSGKIQKFKFLEFYADKLKNLE